MQSINLLVLVYPRKADGGSGADGERMLWEIYSTTDLGPNDVMDALYENV